MDQAIRDFRLEPGDIFQRAQRLDHRLGRPVDARDRRAADRRPFQGPEAGGPYAVPKSIVRPHRQSVDLVQDQGLAYSISSACATSNHCIGAAAEQILLGKQDLMFAGGCEDLD